MIYTTSELLLQHVVLVRVIARIDSTCIATLAAARQGWALLEDFDACIVEDLDRQLLAHCRNNCS